MSAHRPSLLQPRKQTGTPEEQPPLFCPGPSYWCPYLISIHPRPLKDMLRRDELIVMGSGDAAVATDQLHAWNLLTQAIHPFRCLSLTVTPFLDYDVVRAAICLAPPANMLLQLYLPSHWSVVATPTQRYYALCRLDNCRRPARDGHRVVAARGEKKKKTRDTSHVRQSFRVVLRCDRATHGAAFPTLEGNACFSY